MNSMTLKNMKAKIEFDQDAELFRGASLRLTVRTVSELKREFKKSLDVHLAECTRKGIVPYKSYSGKFIARVGPDIHEMISIAAADSDETLNAWVKDTLKQAVYSKVRAQRVFGVESKR